jgi:hypothetical protein
MLETPGGEQLLLRKQRVVAKEKERALQRETAAWQLRHGKADPNVANIGKLANEVVVPGDDEHGAGPSPAIVARISSSETSSSS